MPRILEEDLQLPVLYLINAHNGKLTTSDLSQRLRDLLKPTGEDLELLDGRNDDKFSQIVRNLLAPERPFIKKGFIRRRSERNSPFFITVLGSVYLSKHLSLITFLLRQNFSFSDTTACLRSSIDSANARKKLCIFDENALITEGISTVVQAKRYARSSTLRNAALAHYSIDGRITCHACGFDFEAVYGEMGKGCIEMHHLKPIFMFDEHELEKTVQDALSNIIPLCANCHRMIHKNCTPPMSLDTLKACIRKGAPL